MRFTLFSWIYLVTALIAAGGHFLAMRKRPERGASELGFMFLGVCLCALFVSFETAAHTVWLKFFFSKLAYPWILLVPVFYLLFIYRITGNSRFRQIKQTLGLFLVPLITIIIMATNDWHHWYWSGASAIDPSTNMMLYKHGPVFYLGYVGYSYLLLLIATVELVRFFIRKPEVFQRQGWIIFLASLIPWVSSMIYMWDEKKVYGLDLTTLGYCASGLVYIYAIWRHQLFDLVPVAREMLLDVLDEGILVIDPKGRIQDINAAACRMLQLEATDPVGKSVEQVGIKEPAFLGALPIFTPFQEIRIDSTPKAVVYTLNEYDLFSHTGSRLLVIRDVTEQKEQESQLRRARVEAEENNRLKSAFISNMSHEIRTPMNTILGFLSLLEDPNLGEEDRQEYLKLVRGGGERLLNIINEIIDITRIDAGQVALHITDFDFNELAVNMFYFFKQTAEKKGLQYARVFDIPSEYAIIRSYKEKLYSIFTNLINNAIKYTQIGQIKLTCTLTSNALNFSVEDTGMGIPADQQQAVFDRFIQVDSANRRTQEGSGLGLAITKAYVDMLAGKIWVDSKEGKGSTFNLWLPIEQGHIIPID